MGQLRLNDNVYTGQAGGDGFHVYSTNEQIVGKWIDGKPVYEKVLNVSSFPSASLISIDISSLNVDVMVSATGGA